MFRSWCLIYDSSLKSSLLGIILWGVGVAVKGSDTPTSTNNSAIPATKLFPLTSVRLLDGPCSSAVLANRTYLLALDGDRIEIALPMRNTVERLPDGSDWVAILDGPILLAHPAGTNDLVGLRADDVRMAHVASGPSVPLDKVPVLLSSVADLPAPPKTDAEADGGNALQTQPIAGKNMEE